jgi:hypothetical protein
MYALATGYAQTGQYRRASPAHGEHRCGDVDAVEDGATDRIGPGTGAIDAGCVGRGKDVPGASGIAAGAHVQGATLSERFVQSVAALFRRTGAGHVAGLAHALRADHPSAAAADAAAAVVHAAGAIGGADRRASSLALAARRASLQVLLALPLWYPAGLAVDAQDHLVATDVVLAARPLPLASASCASSSAGSMAAADALTPASTPRKRRRVLVSASAPASAHCLTRASNRVCSTTCLPFTTYSIVSRSDSGHLIRKMAI